MPRDGVEVAVVSELLVPGPARSLAALLDLGSRNAPPLDEGDPLPPLWHWAYLYARPAQSALGPDGHPVAGVPAPPGPGLQRLAAGGRVTTRAALRLGEPATRTGRVSARRRVDGRSGPLDLVTVSHEVSQGGRVAVVEEQDLVYRAPGPLPRDAPGPRAPATGEAAGPATREAAGEPDPLVTLAVDPVVLFRFSAVTGNAHRIHYDPTWAAAEGHHGLVVHGPLQAVLLAEAARRAGLDLVGATLRFRFLAPAHTPTTLTAALDRAADPPLTVRDAAGRVTATGLLTGVDAPA